MNTNLTTIVVLVTLIHVVVLALMIWIRVRRTEGDGITVPDPKVTPCAVCGEPATDWCYDGLDPNEQRDPHTGRAWSADATHYRPGVRDARRPRRVGLRRTDRSTLTLRSTAGRACACVPQTPPFALVRRRLGHTISAGSNSAAGPYSG